MTDFFELEGNSVQFRPGSPFPGGRWGWGTGTRRDGSMWHCEHFDEQYLRFLPHPAVVDRLPMVSKTADRDGASCKAKECKAA